MTKRKQNNRATNVASATLAVTRGSGWHTLTAQEMRPEVELGLRIFVPTTRYGLLRIRDVKDFLAKHEAFDGATRIANDGTCEIILRS